MPHAIIMPSVRPNTMHYTAHCIVKLLTDIGFYPSYHIQLSLSTAIVFYCCFFPQISLVSIITESKCKIFSHYFAKVCFKKSYSSALLYWIWWILNKHFLWWEILTVALPLLLGNKFYIRKWLVITRIFAVVLWTNRGIFVPMVINKPAINHEGQSLWQAGNWPHTDRNIHSLIHWAVHCFKFTGSCYSCSYLKHSHRWFPPCGESEGSWAGQPRWGRPAESCHLRH